MASLRDVQTKISGVKKTKQITKAMNMVASAKLRGAQTRIERFRPYADKFYDMLADLSSKTDASAHPLLEVRDEIKSVGIVLMTSDRGLCGSFNVNLINAALRLARAKAAEGKSVSLYFVGKKGRDSFRKYEEFGKLAEHVNVMNSFDFSLANQVGLDLMGSYLNGELDEVHMIFGEFVSMARQVPVTRQVLPLATEKSEDAETTGSSSDYIYEPDVMGLLAELLPRFVKVQFYRGLLDTSASEHAARMAAMDNATKSCDEMVESLTLLYNKTRQAAITTDLMTIVGGAEALKG